LQQIASACGRSLRLTLKPGQSLRVSGDLVGMEFECDKAVQARVFGLVNHSHSAAAQLLDHMVV